MARRDTPAGATPDDLAEVVAARGIRDERVLAAVRSVPRAAFVPTEYRGSAYVDEPIPITHDQVTTQPSLSARMVEGLALTGGEHVLEVGTGYGFQTALLARLAGDVVSVDRWPDLIERARSHLDAQGIANVHLVVADSGGLGVPAFAPYDAILVSASYPEVPEELAGQLALDGRLVQPIATGPHDLVVVFQRHARGLVRLRALTPARFVPLYRDVPPG